MDEVIVMRLPNSQEPPVTVPAYVDGKYNHDGIVKLMVQGYQQVRPTQEEAK